MTQLQALKIAYGELSVVLPYSGKNNDIQEAAEVILKMISTMEKRTCKQKIKNTLLSKEDRKRMKEMNDILMIAKKLKNR